MPLFVCEECNCVDNTAIGHFWGRNHIKFKDSNKNGKALCTECAPAEFEDGSINTRWGKWHNEFKKEEVKPTDEVINWPKD